MATLTRRTVVLGAGGLAVLAAAGYGGSLTVCGGMDLAALVPLDRLDVALAEIRAPERIGRAWRNREGLAATEAAFLASPDLIRAAATECSETRRALFRERFRADFAAGDVAIADRWVVSRAECLVAALRAV